MKAFFYLTYNGVYSFTDGIATQTKMLLSSLENSYEKFSSIWGDFHFYIICPKEITKKDKLTNSHWNYAERIVTNLNGQIVEISFGTHDIWTLEAWDILSRKASEEIIKIANGNLYEEIFIIVVDPPFLHVPLNCNNNSSKNFKITFLIALYSSAYVHERDNVNQKRLSWEYLGISSVRLYKNIYLGDICNFMTKHLIEYYGADEKRFIPLKSSLNLAHSDFRRLPLKRIQLILKNNNIPTDENLILAFGRADWIKGFDILLNQMSLVNSGTRLVLIVVQYKDELDIVNQYRSIIEKHNIKCSLLIGFNRELPKALCQYKYTKIVVIPSRGEPFSNIPLEVALWARKSGPVCLTSNIDGFQEQIEDRRNGFTFDINNPNELAKKINSILELTDQDVLQIRNSAQKQVLKNRDFTKNFSVTLRHINSL